MIFKYMDFSMKHRDEAAALDRDDPLAGLRDQFALLDGVIYLDGNSLGVPPKASAARAADVIAAEWGEGLIRSWNTAGWFALPKRLGNKLAPLIGAGEDEVVVTDTISANLFKILSAALKLANERDPKRRVIVSERSNFPTDLYIAQGLIEQLDRGYELRLVDDPVGIARRHRRKHRDRDDHARQLPHRLHARHGRAHARRFIARARSPSGIWRIRRARCRSI